MSVISTESFSAFGPNSANDESFTPENVALRNASAANLRRAGYGVHMGANTSAASSSGLVVRPDPLNPDRNALFFSSSGLGTSGAPAAGLRKQIQIVNGEAIVGGFSLFVPSDYVRSSTATSNSCLRVIANASSDSWTALSTDANNPTREVFRVSMDLAVRRATDAPQSEKTISAGRMCFLEYRISPTDVRVWLDDALVLQKSVSLNAECIAILFDQWAAVGGSSTLQGASGRWCIGNWYNLVEDLIAPNARLGPTTRIIGVRPDTDVSAMFVRPSDFPSNAAVMAQDLTDMPQASLQSANVGDQDIYASSFDTSTAGSAMVHAVTTRILAANLESMPHTIRAVIRNHGGVESEPVKPREWRSLDPISTRNLFSVACRPTDGKIFITGASGLILTNDSNGAPGTPWKVIQEDLGTVEYSSIAFRGDGWGCICRNDGKLQFIAPGNDTPGAASSAGGFTIAYHVAVIQGGRFAVSGVNATIGRVALAPTTGAPDVTAGWSVYQLPAATHGGMRMVAYSPTLGTGSGRILAVSDGVSGASNTWRSNDNGVSWTGAYNGNNVGHYACTWDEKAGVFGTFFSSGANPIRKSVDGVAWTAPVAGTTTNGLTTGRVANVLYDYDNATTTIIGDAGTMMVSVNSNDFRPVTRVTTNNLRGICKAANGDYIAVGFSGTVLVYTAGKVDGDLVPLSGYSQHFAAAAVNPSTGAPWTPADAAAAQFGMRVSS